MTNFSQQNYQLLIIDPAVADYQSLLAGVTPNTEVYILDKNRDGIEQITEYLSSSPPSPYLGEGTGVRDSLHIISHGSPGTLYLGNNTLELSNLEKYRHQIQKWDIAHLYIYGCQVAAGDAGEEFLQKLHHITQANIAASNTLTGNVAKGGNWELEIKLGEISPPVALKPDIALTYQGILGAGDLDTSFDTDGKVTTDILSGYDYGYAMTIDSNGKILVAGYAWSGSNDDFALARYNSNGTLDTSFNTTGKVTTDILSSYDYGRAITIDSSGKILVAGYAYNGSNYNDFALVRYDSTGSLDTSFGTNGIVTTDFASGGDQGNAITIDSNGNILVSGYAYNGSNYNDFALVRYNSTGSLDTSFGTNGIVTTDFASGGDQGNAITIDSNGNILVAGYANNGTSNDFALVRYNSNGILDTSFGTGGKVTTDILSGGDQGNAITIDSNGNILVAGYANNGSNDDFALVRYDSTGNLDTSFGTGGKVTTDILSGGDQGNAITIDNGNILVAGYANNGTSNDFALVRYDSTGSLDTSFGTNGIVTTDFASGADYGNAMTIDSNGKILVAGYANNGTSNDFALVRYGTPDIAATTPAVGAATVGPSNTNQLLYRINLAVTEVNATLTGLTLTTGGTYQPADVSNFKLWYSADSTFDATDTQLSSLTPIASGSNLAFTGLTQNIARNTTGYLFITTDIAASPTDARTINLAAPSLTNITFDSGTPTGTPTASNSLTIDALAPTVTNITSTTANASYNATGNINVTVNFSEAVTLAGGNMTVTLDTGGVVTIAPFANSTSAVGTYTPAAGQNSADLNSTSITLATGATLKDAVGNNATLTIPTGQSLADSKAIIVDTVPPTVTIEQDAAQTDPTSSNTINFAVVFSETITGFDNTDITIDGTAGATTATVTGSGNTYNVAVSGMTNSGTVIATVNASAVTDPAGNASAASTSTDNTVTYDLPAPEIEVLDGTTDITDGTITTINLGSTTVGGSLSKTFTINNTGEAELNLSGLTLPTGFTLVGTLPGTIAALGNSTFQVQVDTTAVGSPSGELSFTTNDGDENPFNFPIAATVTAAPVPEIEVLDGTTDITDGTITTINLGSTTVGGSLSKTFTINNTGEAELNLSGLTLPTGFTLVGTLPGTIAALGNGTFQVQVDTTAVGSPSGELSFTTNDGDENPFNFPIAATVTAVTLPPTNGGDTAIGTPGTLVLPATTEPDTTATPEITPDVHNCPPMPEPPIVNFEIFATIPGTDNDDILTGDNNANVINGYTGNDILLGLDSSDTIIGSISGDDPDTSSNDKDSIYGGEDSDFINGAQGDDLLWGDRGSDTIMGDNGNDVIFGGPGDPKLWDTDLGDVLYGDAGDDIVLGNQGNDSLSGGDGNDLLYGGQHDDLVHGDAGNDFLYGDKGSDILCAGDGDDTLYGGTGNDTGVGQNGEKDWLHGGAGNDIIFASEGDDTLEGDIGDDTLYGGKDNDIILGGDGSDILSGDKGDDTLTGGGGSDTFRILANAGTDIITDWVDGEDMIGLAGGLAWAELSIFATTDGFAAISAGGSTLAIFNGVDVSLITSDDFMSVG